MPSGVPLFDSNDVEADMSMVVTLCLCLNSCQLEESVTSGNSVSGGDDDGVGCGCHHVCTSVGACYSVCVCVRGEELGGAKVKERLSETYRVDNRALILCQENVALL